MSDHRNDQPKNAHEQEELTASSPNTERRRNQKGQYLPGVSGNPAGRPATPAEVKDAAQCYSVAAVDVLGAVLTDETRSMSMRVRAAQTLLRTSKAQEKAGEQARNRARLLERLTEWQQQSQHHQPKPAVPVCEPPPAWPAVPSPATRQHSFSAQHAAAKKGPNGWAFGG